jgi:hypothetical protein
MLPPPAPGAHTIHFAGELMGTPNFDLDVTYNFTIAN